MSGGGWKGKGWRQGGTDEEGEAEHIRWKFSGVVISLGSG